MLAGIATLSEGGTLNETFLRRRLHDHDLPNTEVLDQVVIRAPIVQDRCMIILYFHPFNTRDEVP